MTAIEAAPPTPHTTTLPAPTAVGSRARVVALPAATRYEKADLSSTDMHPFVHAFTPAIGRLVGSHPPRRGW